MEDRMTADLYRLNDYAKPPKPRVVATSPYLNREVRSLEQVRAERARVELPVDCEQKDFAE